MRIIKSIKDTRVVMGMAMCLVVLIGGSYFLIVSTVDVLIKKDAEAAALGWANYFSRSLDEIEQIAAGKMLSAENKSFIEEARSIGQVFRFNLFDSDGRIRLVSDDLDNAGRDDSDLAEHNPKALAVLESGQAYTVVKEGTPPTRPLLYAESYVPVMKDGRTVAIVEVYLDQTAKQQLFQSQFGATTLALVAIIALSFGAPTAAYFWRTRQKRKSDQHIQILANDAVERERMATEQKQRRAEEIERSQKIEASIRKFEGGMHAALTGIGGTVNKLEVVSTTLTSNAQDVSERSSIAGNAIGSACEDVETVASAAEQLAASINESAAEATKSSEVAGRAVSEANKTTKTMRGLSDAANRIGEVVGLIQDIAEQTNLLALNATIE
ncbi:MAG: methyl-accepting chemotaxis protein, partial [Hyphomicrobiales bacterium]|nr:methyl-accepting chemotaxis protein [Hyphomicrobiales bacterium]